jgi:hypothetical protein
MNTVCVIGANGNMGRRYMAIMGQMWPSGFGGVDIGEPMPRASHYIIATPTGTHLDVLAKVIDEHGTNGDLNILIEKPVTKNPDHFDFVLGTKNKIYMANQYAYAFPSGPKPKFDTEDTEYNYYNSGNDGIGWDCIQLLHLATGPVELKKDSAVWRCKINGRWLRREMIDHLYIRMIKDFLSGNKAYGRLWGPEDIIAAHKKALQYEKSIDRGTGPQRVNAP